MGQLIRTPWRSFPSITTIFERKDRDMRKIITKGEALERLTKAGKRNRLPDTGETIHLGNKIGLTRMRSGNALRCVLHGTSARLARV